MKYFHKWEKRQGSKGLEMNKRSYEIRNTCTSGKNGKVLEVVLTKEVTTFY